MAVSVTSVKQCLGVLSLVFSLFDRCYTDKLKLAAAQSLISSMMSENKAR